jgi:hypothetical protein
MTRSTGLLTGVPHDRTFDRPHDRAGFDRYCTELFSSMQRADQRRVAGGYLAGLVYLTGRRSARRMAAISGDPGAAAGKTLQHFVNHSPWSVGAVRSRILSAVGDAFEPLAWTVDEVAFVKHGPYSAGVDRQFSAWTGGEANCQLGVCLSVLGDTVSAPITWRLALPASWDADERRRARARVPSHVVSRPHWEHVVDLLDDLLLRWGVVTPAPLVIDMVGRQGVDPLIDALEARAVDYVIRVDPELEVSAGRSHAAAVRRVGARRPRPGAGSTSGPIAGSTTGARGGAGSRTTLSELARPAAERHRPTVIWSHGPQQEPRRSQFVTMALDLPGQATGLAAIGAPDRALMLVADWPAGARRPRDAWLTNLSHRRLGEVVSLATSRWRSRAALAGLGERLGLFDHEGRTFLGWHHHVTLACAGNAFLLDRTLRAARRDDERRPAVQGRPALQIAAATAL